MNTVSKEDRILQVSEAILDEIEKNGVENFSVTEVHKKSEVSRAWVYKYFGSSRSKMIHSAIDFFGRTLAEIDQTVSLENKNILNPAHPDWMQNRTEGFNRFIQHCVRLPWFIRLYLRLKSDSGEFGKHVTEIEEAWFQIYTMTLKSTPKSIQSKLKTLAKIDLSFRIGCGFYISNCKPGERAETSQAMESSYRLLIKSYLQD